MHVRQNTSHAVMSQRHEKPDSLDNFPTPPWATRALIENVLNKNAVRGLTCLEPACGQGHMANTLNEYFKEVCAIDVFDYGYGETLNFLSYAPKTKYDWVITNPPFRLAEAFVLKALSMSEIGVAMLVRTVFIESVGRYERLFNIHRPSIVAQFSERVPMVRGRLDRKASTATGYAWILWNTISAEYCETVWIPPCRKSLERDTDYAPLSTQENLSAAEAAYLRENSLFPDFGT